MNADSAGNMAADMAAALEGWPEPEAYPLGALPESIHAAVAEVVSAVQCPPALAGMAALAVLSTAAQAYVDVTRDEGLSGPTSLYLLAIADSGERKTTVDRHFGRVLRDFERKALADQQPERLRYEAAQAAWDAHKTGLLAAIRDAARKRGDNEELQAQLASHMAAPPVPVLMPALALSDATPEALAWSLHTSWPSSSLTAHEGGLVLGAHAMSRDSIMRHLALLNALWDGAEHRVSRRTSDSYLLAGRRLTLWVQAQPPTLAQYLADHGALARGIGWLARCLIAQPQSTQGTRFYQPPPSGWPALANYHARITGLLDRGLPMDGDRLQPYRLHLRGDAHTEWTRYHDDVERNLAVGGELATVRDGAAKAADNAARLAALFAAYDHRDTITADDFERGAALVTWHLYEARRILPRVAAAGRPSDVSRLLSWVRAQPSAPKRRDAQRCGPVRDSARLDAAIAEAEGNGALRVLADGTLTVEG